MNAVSALPPVADSTVADLRSTQARAAEGGFLDALRKGADHGPKLAENDELRQQFTNFVGQSLFGQALASMRKTVDKPAYFNGGRAEEVFQEQLDKRLVEHVTAAAGERFTQPMFELFALQRR